MDSAITRYSSTALAGAALHSDMLATGKAQLRGICDTLAPGAEVTVRFMATVTPEMDGRYVGARVFQDVASIHIGRRLEGRALDITATIGRYARGAYQDTLTLEDIRREPSRGAASSALTTVLRERGGGAAVAASAAGTEEISVARYPLVTASNIERLRTLAGTGESREALTIASLVNEMFAGGVPLPRGAGLVHLDFTVVVSSPAASVGIPRFQMATFYHNFKASGAGPSLAIECLGSGVAVASAGASGRSASSYELDKMFEQTKKEAEGTARPMWVVGDAVRVSGGTVGGVARIGDASRHEPLAAAAGAGILALEDGSA